MKRLLTFALLASLLTISSCDLLDPKEDETPAEVDNDHLATEVIGPAGGEIDLDSLMITIPANAFSEDNELSIYVDPDNDGFGEYGISATYKITGLPTTINSPLRFKIRYHGTIEGDTLVALGEMQFSTTDDDYVSSYHTDRASGSAGYVIYDLPVYSNLKTSAGANAKNSYAYPIYILILGGYVSELSSDGHFKLSYPIAYNSQGIAMGEHFETALDTCEALGSSGFSLSGRDLLADPAFVLAKPLSSSNGQYSYRISHVQYDASVTDQELRSYMHVGGFAIDFGTLNDDAKLRTVCGHEFLHLVQNLYEFSSPNIEPEQVWLKEATSVWIMEKYSTLPYYVPHSAVNREMYLFDGWQYKDRGYARQGYGLSVIFKEIEKIYGVDKIIDIFDTIKAGTLPSGAVDPVDAVLSVLDEPVSTFWHGVLGAYLLGDYYDNQVNVKFLERNTSYAETVTIDAQNNTHSLYYLYHDLSGKLFKIQAGDIGALSSVPLSLSVDDPTNCGILVCKYKQGSDIVSIDEVYPGESGQIVLADVKPIFEDGYELVVLVSNSSRNKDSNYQGSNDVKLNIETVSSDVLNGKLEFYLDTAQFQNSDGGFPYSDYLNEVLYLNDVSGSFSNNIFTGNYSYQSLGRTYSGNVRLTYLDNPSRINIALNNTMTYESSFGYGTVTINYTVDYNGVPYDGTNPTSGNYEYSETGSTVQQINVTWRETNAIYIKTYLNSTCGQNAYIRLSVDTRPAEL